MKNCYTILYLFERSPEKGCDSDRNNRFDAADRFIIMLGNIRTYIYKNITSYFLFHDFRVLNNDSTRTRVLYLQLN